MVFGVGVELYEGDEMRRIVDVEVTDFQNMGDFIIVRFLGYPFSIDLFMSNFTPITPLPNAAIESNFKLRSRYLLNEGYGHATLEYSVRLGQRYTSYIDYEVYISEGGLSLSHYNFIIQLYVLATVSSLV